MNSLKLPFRIRIAFRTDRGIRNSLRWALGIPLLLATLIVGAFGLQSQRLLALSEWLSRSEETISQLWHTQKMVLDLETASRGYMLHRNPVLLEPYQRARVFLPAQWERLRKLAAPGEASPIDAVEEKVNSWITFRQVIFSDPKPQAARFFLEGKQRMDEIRIAFAELIRQQELVRDEHRTQVLAGAKLSFVLGMGLALVLVIVVFLVHWRVVVTLGNTYETAIAERDKAVEDLSQSNTMLESRVLERTAALTASNQELESFCYSVSHDLRAPLRGIDGFSQALSEDYGDTLDDKARGYIRYVREGVQRMGVLIDDLLRLSRLTRVPLKQERLNLSQTAQEVLDTLRLSDPDREVQIDIEPGIYASGDPVLLRTVLENLLGNAWKFTAKKKDARIRFQMDQKTDSPAVFTVSDNGAGFDMDYYSQLFGAFQRLHANSEFPGNGVGLATVRRVIQRHGGSVWAEGKPGEGASFHFTLEPKLFDGEMDGHGKQNNPVN